MKKFVIFFLGIYVYSLSFANPNLTKPIEKPEITENIKPNLPSEIPLIPLIPALPNVVENIDEEGNIRNLEKNYTVMIEAKVNIFVPLEIVSDISIDTTVFGVPSGKRGITTLRNFETLYKPLILLRL